MKIITVNKEAPKLRGKGNIKYQLWINDKCYLYVQFNENKETGTFSGLLFSVTKYATVRNHSQSIGYPKGYDLADKTYKFSENDNDGAFLKAVLKHLLQ